jgi:(R,R)-butanediol dehydrogenase/meso-butanediol dehydrogenase/diacetyl reductase
MSAAVLKGPGRLDVEEVPIPDLDAGQVLVEVEHCGVCGTDLHLVLEGWGQPGSVPGHEWTGRVVAVGDGVSAWAAGDAVVGGVPVPCGRCPHCASGRLSLCDHRDIGGGDANGAFAQFVAVDAASVLRRPAAMDSRTAALVEPLAVALHAIERSGAEPGHRVLVSGAGPIGALTIAALRALGVDDISCVEPGLARRALAADVGATEVRLPTALDLPSIAEPRRVACGAVDVAIECSGKAVAVEAALAQLRRGGTLVLVGAGVDPPSLDANRVLLNELVVTGAFEYGSGGFERALDLLGSGRLPVDRLLEPDDVPLAGALDAMRELADGTRAGKVLVAP